MFHLSDKTVTTLSQSLNVSRSFDRIPKRKPEPGNRGIHSMLEIDKCVIGPEAASEFVSGYDCARVLQ
jgi:hypothetical protein